MYWHNVALLTDIYCNGHAAFDRLEYCATQRCNDVRLEYLLFLIEFYGH